MKLKGAAHIAAATAASAGIVHLSHEATAIFQAGSLDLNAGLTVAAVGFGAALITELGGRQVARAVVANAKERNPFTSARDVFGRLARSLSPQHRKALLAVDRYEPLVMGGFIVGVSAISVGLGTLPGGEYVAALVSGIGAGTVVAAHGIAGGIRRAQKEEELSPLPKAPRR